MWSKILTAYTLDSSVQQMWEEFHNEYVSKAVSHNISHSVVLHQKLMSGIQWHFISSN